MHEILTLQLGHRANYLATHFWNTQESYFQYDATDDPSTVDHDIHFRPGQGPTGEDTYTPRTVIYDLKGGFGGLRKWGGLYDQGDIEGDLENLWDGSAVKQKDKPIPQSEHQKALDGGLDQPSRLSTQSVRYWSDYTRVFYHPRSIVHINDYELGSTIMPFEKWASGEELFGKLDKDRDLLDRDIRPWAEECDQLQGVQIFASDDDAWGGFSSSYVESLRDEYGKTSLWFWGLQEDVSQGQRAKRILRTVNTAQSLQAISPLTSMYVPLATPSYIPPYLSIDRSSQWHIGGLLSMTVESMTLPTRQKPGSANRGLLRDFEETLNSNGNQRVAELQCSIVDQLQERSNENASSTAASDSRMPDSTHLGLVYEDEVEKANSKLDMSFMSSNSSQTALSLRQREKANHVFAKVESVRGLAWVQEDYDEQEAATSRKRQRLASLPIVEKYYNPSPFPMLDSFPSIISEALSTGQTMAIHGSLSTTSQISKWTKALQNYVSRMVEVADREALANGLGEMAEAYEEGWDSASDVDSD
ncbi:MAG: hypothetical protein LQ352_002938 [Teloschistes flavicans]|nr:MAG: hypothetical protein LQ352_002938 [Teloschistes flavicans]